MKKSSKYIILLSCLFLVAIFFLPLWYIKLDAPQYPGGLDMYIWVSKITGTDEFTLQNINILNHYIGMEAIHPDSFSELKIMPYVLAFFCAAGLAIIFLNNKKYLFAWIAMLFIGGTIGLIDFYLWQQAFGNNLDPQAPIKIEGMTYSPPFFGIKTILNITATSLPHLGGIAFFLAIALGAVALFNELKKNKIMNKKRVQNFASFALLLSILSCSPQQESIEYGFDACEHCKMTITDSRYGSELVTDKGKVYKFDSIECLAMYITEDSRKDASWSMVLVTDFLKPEQFLEAQEAWYLKSESLPSPMGMGLTAFATENDVREHQSNYPGEVLHWEEIKLVVNDSHMDQVQKHAHEDHAGQEVQNHHH